MKVVALVGTLLVGMAAQVNGQQVEAPTSPYADTAGTLGTRAHAVRLGSAVRGVLALKGLSGTASASPATERAAAAEGAALQPTDKPANGSQVVALGVIVRARDPEIRAMAVRGDRPPREFIDSVEGTQFLGLKYERAMSGGYFVFQFESPQTGEAVDRIIRDLVALPILDHVEADTLMRSHATSSDPLYLAYQWNMLGPGSGFSGGVDAANAWTFTTGSHQTVVAVLDTGVNPHPEFANRLVQGFDFVSDPVASNDGDGRDPDASDPGDWEWSGECMAGSPAKSSSWHGTHVAGIVAASGGNGFGVAGISWSTRIQPVRVLGKCGGRVSDIIDGITWASGLPVPGVPINPTPAQVINLSLGGYSPSGCSLAYQSTINKAVGQGVLVVVAAGNQSQNAALYTPANCEGILTVMAVGPLGALASYTNYGFVSDISAPGGDMSLYGEIGGIYSTVSTGPTVPTGYTFEWQQGTSMAAPHVSGIAALALAVNPNLSGAELVFLLQFAAAPFPAASLCNSLNICGAGIASASGGILYAAAFSDYRLVYEFFNVGLKHFFRTGAKEEAALVNSGWAGEDWFDTLDYFYGWNGPIDGAQPVCRFYGTPGIGPNSHFYTADAAECEAVKKYVGWTYEGIAFYMKVPVNSLCAPGTKPVHRYYNMRWRENDSNHRYTSNLETYDAMTASGWVYEGVAFCSAF